jgi:hypothetical protein
VANAVEFNSNTSGITLSDDDQFGTSVANIGDLDGNGVNDLAVGANSDDTGGTNRGAVHLLYLNANGTLANSVALNSNTSGITLSNGDNFGYSLANMGDLDGNGVIDLAVGAHFDNTGGYRRGAVHLLYLNADGTLVNIVELNSNTSGISLSNSDFFGASVANMGDLDGNGVNDLAVGAIRDDTGGTDRGAVHLLYLNANGTLANSVALNSNTSGIILSNSDRFGTSLANMGDLDGNGVNDLAVGANFDDAGGANRGAVHLLYLNADGTLVNTVELNSNTNRITLSNGDQFGFSAENMGDLDGNGVNDLAVGVVQDDAGGTNRGAVHLLLLNANGTLVYSRELNSNTSGIALSNDDRFGRSITNMGDLDGNGVNDLAVGASRDDAGGTDRGAVHLLYLNVRFGFMRHGKFFSHGREQKMEF